MKIKIYQVNPYRSGNRVAFLGLDTLSKLFGTSEVDSSIYDSVYAGEVNCNDLEDVFTKFNSDYPANYQARSLSVSDVVEVIESDTVKPGFYFCDTIGFKEIPFDPSKAQISNRFCDDEKKNTISVLLVQPNKHPKMIEIEEGLESMQKIVGGDIEEYMPFDDEVAIICNDEGKNMGLPLNRAIFSDDGNLVDIIAGDFFIAYAPAMSEKLLSLPDDLAKKYNKKFFSPDVFVNTSKGIQVIRIP